MCDQEAPNTVDAANCSASDNTNPQDSSLSIHQNDSSIDSTVSQEATDNDKQCNDFDQASNISRELKSLLALSKEANLKTNISHKRKKEAARSFSPQTDSKKSLKLATESKHFKFPVTAEAELEELTENENKLQNETVKFFKRKRNSLSENSGSAADSEEFSKRNKKTPHREYKVFLPNKDIFCWRCHREGVNIACETCPRSYHQKCLKQTITDASHWPCPECVAILKAESTQTRSPAMKGMTLEHLCSLLKFAVNRMIQCHGSEPFLHPVNIKEFPEYKKYITEPMDLTMLEKNIKDNIYGSTQAFEADAKWLLHNSIIFNSYQSKLTSSAKTMIKICKQEMMEIENCPSCYLKANTNKSTWFVEVCPKPHILVWAKLKGFPYWPAKAMSINSSGMVDVRFFGAHDRAWVHYKDCYLYSEKDPNTFKQKRFDIEKCVEELNFYIENLKKIYGEFRYAPFRTLLDSEDIYKQLIIFLPKYKSIQARRRSTIDSIDAKSEEQNDSKSVPKEEISEDPEKSEASSHSNMTTPIQDNDTTMEGYGTDDDMRSEIDHESRKAFAEKKELNSDDKSEDEEDDEDDTQIPANVSADGTLHRGKARTRGGFNHASGKLKVLPRLSLENHISDDVSSPTRKTSRRNSDQSVKSDSSRISNVSDKINRVSISENMEITLGNEDVGYVSISENINSLNGENSEPGSENTCDIKKKPVQVDIENAEFSISPNKVKISDKLIKKLTDDHRTERVKKSLEKVHSRGKKSEPCSLSTNQTKININGEIKPSLDEDTFIKNKLDYEPDERTKAKTIQPSITEYMTAVPKIIDVITESQPSSSKEKVSKLIINSDKNSNSNSELISEKMDVELTSIEEIKSIPTESVLKNQSEVLPKPSTEHCSVLETNMQVSVPNKVSNDDTEKQKDNQQLKTKLVETLIPKNVQEMLGAEKKKDNEQLKVVKVASSVSEPSRSVSDKVIAKIVPMEIVTQESDASPSKKLDITNSNNKIESLSKNKNIIVISENKTDSKSISHKLKLLEEEITFSKVKPVSIQGTEKAVGNKESSMQGTEKIVGNKESSIQGLENKESSLQGTEKAAENKESSIPETEKSVGNKESSIQGIEKEVENKESSIQGTEKAVENKESSIQGTEKAVGNKVSSIIGPSTSKDTSYKNANKDSVVDIADELNDEDEEEDMATIENMVNLVYDKKNIFDVIHSSLRPGDVDKTANVLNKKKEINRPFRFVTQTDPSKKRKLNTEETHSPAKIVKLVSIESILKKKDKDDAETAEQYLENRIIEKSAPTPVHFLTPEDIKSELESEDELMTDVSQMEEKRKYLNALNIYERSAEIEKKEKNEIRTRSKAEEKRERFKVVDNLTRIIDDVAMNYSAQHEGEKIPQRKVERRKSTGGAPTREGEIYVKSFAKIPAPPCGKQRARKTFPIPYYIKQTVKTPIMPRRDISVLRKDQPPQKMLNTTGTVKYVQEKQVVSSPNTCTKAVSSSTVTTVSPSVSLAHSTPVSEASETPQMSTALTQPSFGVVTSSSSSIGLLPTTSSGGSCLMTQTTANPHTMAMGHVILMSGPSVNYCQPISNPGLNLVSHPAASLTTSSLNSQTQMSVLKTTLQAPNVRTSQNYIPHDDSDSSESSSSVSATNNCNNSLNEPSNKKSQDTSNIPVPPTNSNNNINTTEQSPSTSTNTNNSINNTNNSINNNNPPPPPPPPPMAAIEQEDEFAVLNGLVPESVSRAVSELLLRPPPRLKPRPPGVTSQNFDEGMPSTAGDVTTKINSIAHRMTDYFRGMLIETLEDIGRTTTPEAKITSLQLEIESLKHTHNLEMAEMRKNVCTILKDIQRSIVEERDKIVDETRAACESETIRRVELAKSKQWCANCPKEAQFYCCWNTSYCDYPCQQKHWPQHAGKCTQSIEKATGAGLVPPPRTGVQPIVLRPALTAPKPMGRIIAKPAKVYLNKANTPQKNKTVPTSGLTLVETTPGNYELVSNGSIGLAGKIFTTSAATVASTKYKVLTSSAGTSPRPSDPTRQASSSSTKPQYII